MTPNYRDSLEILEILENEAGKNCCKEESGFFCRPCWARWVLTGEDRCVFPEDEE